MITITIPGPPYVSGLQVRPRHPWGRWMTAEENEEVLLMKHLTRI